MTNRDSNGAGRGLVGQEQPQPRSLAGSPGPDPGAKNGVRSTPAPGPSGAQHSVWVPAPSVAIGGRRERKMVCDSYSRREGETGTEPNGPGRCPGTRLKILNSLLPLYFHHIGTSQPKPGNLSSKGPKL